MPSIDDIQQAIARNLRRLRQRRDLSLEELAVRAAVSRAMIVQIEQARTNPSINTLCLLADALGESVHALVSIEDESPVRVISEEEAVELWRGKRGSVARVLAGAGSSGPVELWEWQLKLGDTYSAPAHSTGTREMLFVIAGEVRLELGEREYTASAGQTLVFSADEVHRYAALGKAGARLLMVVLEPPVATISAPRARSRVAKGKPLARKAGPG